MINISSLLLSYITYFKFISNCSHLQVCSVHFRQGRPSNDPSHEDFAPHLFLQRSISQPVAKTLTYLESLANDDDFDELVRVLNVFLFHFIPLL